MRANLFSRHVGAEQVGGGVYWGHKAGGFVSVPRGGGALPGQPSDAFTRVPILVVLVVGPILGTAFALFLPALAFVGIVQVILGRLPRTRARATATAAPAEYLGATMGPVTDLQP